MTTTYRGFEIIPVYNYGSGKHDFQVYREGEQGTIKGHCTLKDVKADIDEYREEHPEMHEVRISKGTVSVIPGLLDALAFAKMFDGILLTEFNSI